MLVEVICQAHTVSSYCTADLVAFMAAKICLGLVFHEGTRASRKARFFVSSGSERGVVTHELFIPFFGPRCGVRAAQCWFQGFGLRVGWLIGPRECLAHGANCKCDICCYEFVQKIVLFNVREPRNGTLR